MHSPARILVVDAAADSRERSAIVLERAGFVVTESASGADTLDVVRTVRPDVVVLDGHPPDVDAVDLCRRLEAEPSTSAIPVLVLSPVTTAADPRTGALPHGAEIHLTRPCDAAELVSAVTSLVRLRRAETAVRVRDSLLAIARAVGGMADTIETLRVVCRELARLTGADTVGAHVLDRERGDLRSVADYHVPDDALGTLATSGASSTLRWPAAIRPGELTWSDDVAHDDRFAVPLFRAFAHRSGIVIPLVVDGQVEGIFYLVWWTEPRRVDPSEAAMLEAIGREVGMLLTNSRRIEHAEVRRRVAEAAKEHYHLLFERNLAGVFRSARDGRLIECNEAFARLLGYRSPADAVRQNAWDFYVDPVERDRIIERLGSERRITNQEIRWRRAGGQELLVMMNASRIGEGDDAQVEGIVLDLTDRARAEEAVRRREAQLRNLGDNLPDGVIYQVVRRPDGSNHFPYMSSGLERRYGVRAADAMNDASLAYRLVLPEDLARIRAASDESIRTGGPVEAEYRMRTPSGEIRWMHLRGRPTPLPDGATQWDVVALDITDRKRVEERFRLVFERSFVGIFRTRPDGIVLDCNDAFARILGYGNADEMRGRSVTGHYATPADRDMVVARISGGEDVIDAELVGRRRDGSLVPVAMSVRRVVDRDGPVHEGVLVDLTDRKRAEESVALRYVAELANAAAHEINNPLAVILGDLELVQEGAVAADRAERTRAAALRIRDIVAHMTRITRLEQSERFPGLPRMLDIRRSGPRPQD